MAYVLAGGRGSRLKELTDRRAKPAVFFGGKVRIIDFALSNALNSGIRRIGVATQYKAHSLIRHLQRGWNFLRPERNESFDILNSRYREQQLSMLPPLRFSNKSTTSTNGKLGHPGRRWIQTPRILMRGRLQAKALSFTGTAKATLVQGA
jgi:NDP-sugar pyrophosphorylase family protein